MKFAFFAFANLLGAGTPAGASLLPEMTEYPFFNLLFIVLSQKLSMNCVNIITHDRDIAHIDNRATNFAFESLSSFDLVRTVVRNDVVLAHHLIRRRKCKSFLLFTDDVEFVHHILTSTRTHVFPPLTNVFLVFFGTQNINFDLARRKILRLNNRRAVNVISIHLNFDAIMNWNYTTSLYLFSYSLFQRRIDFSRQTTLTDLIVFFQLGTWEPLFNENEPYHEFRVGLFHCPPFVINTGFIGNSTSYDGVEYRFMRETTRGWNVRIIDVNYQCPKCDPWHTLRQALLANWTDMSLCSLEMKKENLDDLDLSTPYDYQCGTFLVRVPKPISKVKYIYMALRPPVWYTYILYFSLMSLALVGLARLSLRIHPDQRRTLQKLTLSRSFTEIVNVATLHGFSVFPANWPIRILTITWMYSSLIIGTSYSTGYISILAKPRDERPINTLKDLLDRGIYWGTRGDMDFRKDPFYKTNNSEYIEFANRLVKEDSWEDQRRNLENSSYARYVRILCQNYVSESESYVDYFSRLRLMKDCIFNYYNVYGFQKNTPFASYFSAHNTRLFEAGIYQYWSKDIKYKYSPKSMDILFGNNKYDSPQARKFTLESLTSPFYLLSICTGVAIFTFVLELIWDILGRLIK